MGLKLCNYCVIYHFFAFPSCLLSVLTSFIPTRYISNTRYRYWHGVPSHLLSYRRFEPEPRSAWAVEGRAALGCGPTPPVTWFAWHVTRGTWHMAPSRFEQTKEPGGDNTMSHYLVAAAGKAGNVRGENKRQDAHVCEHLPAQVWSKLVIGLEQKINMFNWNIRSFFHWSWEILEFVVIHTCSACQGMKSIDENFLFSRPRVAREGLTN